MSHSHKFDFDYVKTLAHLESWADGFLAGYPAGEPKRFSFDTETTALAYDELEIVGMSFYNGKQKPMYVQFNFSATVEDKVKDGRKTIKKEVPYKHKGGVDIQDALPILQRVFDGSELVTANGKFDLKVLHRIGIEPGKIVGDSNMAAYLYDNTFKGGLKDYWAHYKKEKTETYEQVTGMKAGKIDWRQVDYFQYGAYGAKDPYMTWVLESMLYPKLQEMKVDKCYHNLEIPLIASVAKTEIRGVKMDREFLSTMSVNLTKEIARLENEIFSLMGCSINLNSSKQLANILYDVMRIPCVALTEKGERSTGEDALKELSYRGYFIADLLINHRQASKIKGTYADGLQEMINPDGRLRGSFNQAFADTGRFTSSGPNLQNQPNNKKWPIKDAYIAGPGRKLLVLDWSNIEVRVMAHESGDAVLTDLFRNGGDMHQNTIDMVFKMTGIRLPRSQAKRVNFGVLYGMWGESLAIALNFDMMDEVRSGNMTHEEFRKNKFSAEQGQALVDSFYKAYTGFTAWSKQVAKEAKVKRYVRSMSGRIRRIPDAHTNRGARQAVNFIIQGGAADLMKLGIIKLDEMYHREMFDATTILYVHDEYVIDVAEEQAEECFAAVKHLLENIHPNFKVPIVVEGGIYDSWNGLKGGAKFKSYGMSSMDLMLLNII